MAKKKTARTMPMKGKMEMPMMKTKMPMSQSQMKKTMKQRMK